MNIFIVIEENFFEILIAVTFLSKLFFFVDKDNDGLNECSVNVGTFTNSLLILISLRLDERKF